jgi:hypothetical protein
MAGVRIGGLAILAAALAGCASAAPSLPAEPLDVRIDTVQRDWHTDLTGPLAKLAGGFRGARVLCFGFGERQYMLEKDHSTLAMLTSLLPSRAVVLATPLPGAPAETVTRNQGFLDIETLHVSRAGVASLSGFVWRSIQTTPDGAPVRLGPGSTPGSAFFAASGTYNAFATCNTWTATGLRTAGLPIDDAVIFVDDLMPQVRRVARAQAAPADR